MRFQKLKESLRHFEIRVKIPIFGIGCGVLGLSLKSTSLKLGEYASRLLRALEYRGYDSTGGVFQDEKGNITLLKDVGAPSTLVKTLGIEKQAGIIFCGQVRWATFGAVDKVNAQPHRVNCRRNIYGAHNGNITNTRELKAFLSKDGHTVMSDNDGEMLVHAIEHYFDIELNKLPKQEHTDKQKRLESMRTAIQHAAKRAVGSYAAVVVDPMTETSWAIKSGSSLYFGVGVIDGNNFCLASSDLTSVLRFTKDLVNLREGEFVEYAADQYQVYAQKDLIFRHVEKEDEIYTSGQLIEKKTIRSKLRAEDTELVAPFEYFMDQEIHSEIESTGKLIKIFNGGSNTGRRMIEFLRKEGFDKQLRKLSEKITHITKFKEQQKLFDSFITSEESDKFLQLVETEYSPIYDELVKENFVDKYFFSSEKNLFIELAGAEFDKKRLLTAKALDSLVEVSDVKEFSDKVELFIKLLKDTAKAKGVVYSIACGTSYHATKIGAQFFNEIAGFEIIPILPGDFRGEYSHSIKDSDLIIGVSQSGETKDLIDIYNDIIHSELKVTRAVIVNNVNSTLGQEKSDVAIPIFCGPEIAVPATKSFINQITIFYYLALKTAEMKIGLMKENGCCEQEIKRIEEQLSIHQENLQKIPKLLEATLVSTDDLINELAKKIYLDPSIHLLATKISGVAMEGALKIRETVLNHAEGREASEFKHGPNTILGKNTVFGMKSLRSLYKNIVSVIDEVEHEAKKRGITDKEVGKIIREMFNFTYSQIMPFNLSKEGTQLFKDMVGKSNDFECMFRNYPLIYITGPDERDVNLTISQINTHKIRGANTYVIAEYNEKLFQDVSKDPFDGKKYYHWMYIPLPKTDDTLMVCFSSSLVLQRLALKMSIRKMEYLDKLKIQDHGVHPDVPKNVSKSITVD
jgi:glucosamine 6-phosphate synthetase-like amidotransferase/phosphosugar isomerase protein